MRWKRRSFGLVKNLLEMVVAGRDGGQIRVLDFCDRVSKNSVYYSAGGSVWVLPQALPFTVFSPSHDFTRGTVYVGIVDDKP